MSTTRSAQTTAGDRPRNVPPHPPPGSRQPWLSKMSRVSSVGRPASKSPSAANGATMAAMNPGSLSATRSHGSDITRFISAPNSTATSSATPAIHSSAGRGSSATISRNDRSRSASATPISGTSIVPHAGVDYRVQEVLYDVDDHDHGDVDEHERSDERQVGLHDRLVEQVAETRDGEDRLDGDGPADEQERLARDDGHQRDEGVPEDVLPDERPRWDALRARRLDVVRVHRLQHRSPPDAHLVAHGCGPENERRGCDHLERDEHLVRVEGVAERRRADDVRRDDPVLPVEAEERVLRSGEDLHQDDGQPEVRHGAPDDTTER